MTDESAALLAELREHCRICRVCRPEDGVYCKAVERDAEDLFLYRRHAALAGREAR